MTTAHAPADDAVTGAEHRHGFAVDLTDVAIFYTTHSARVPTRRMNIEVEGGTAQEKLADLEQIARDLQVTVETQDDGTLIAARQFGDLEVEAHIAVKDRTMDDYRNRMAHARDAGVTRTATAA